MKLSSFAFLAVLYLAAFAAVSGSNANNNKNAARLKKFLFGPGSDNVEMWDKVFSSPSQNTQTVSQVGGIFDSDADRARNAIENDSITDFTAYWVKMVSKGSNEINHVYKDGYTPLLLAIEFNNEAIFDKIALTPGVKLIAKKSDGQTPLIASIQVGSIYMAHKLLSELEADPNAPNAAGVSPLGAVIAYLAEENLSDALGMIHLLANKGAKIDVAITEGKTVHATVALAATLSKGVAAPAIEALLQHKADPNLTTYRFVSGADYDGVNYPVAIAAENGDVAAFNLLARNKANLNLPSALMYNAVATGDVRMIEAALSMSVNINAVHKKTGYTGLCRAVAASDVNTVRELLERKASPTIASPLHVLTKKAQYFKDEEPAARIAMGKMLIVAGADVNEDFSQKTEWQSWADYTPMTMLFGTRLDYSELIAFMIQRGAKIERVSPRDGRTPIMIAIDALKPQYVKMLLDAGADYESVDYSGFTPKLHIAKIKAGTPRSYRDEMKTRLAGLVSGLPNTLFQAVQKGTIENVSSAVQRSMDGRHPSIDTYRDPDSGNNALMEAVALGKVEMVEYLISYGAAVNEANRKTRATPLEIALHHNKASVIEAVQKEVQFQQWLHTRDHLPTELTCPITQQIMYVPVHIPIRTNGRKQNSATFEASAIGKWLFTHDALPTDGIRGARMTDLVLNESVQEKIKQLRVNWEASQYSQDA